MVDSKLQWRGLELSGLQNETVYLLAKNVYVRYGVAYNTFQKHLRALALSGRYPDAFRFTDSLSRITGSGVREYYRIDIHPIRGIEVLDKHFGYIERYGVRRGV